MYCLQLKLSREEYQNASLSKKEYFLQLLFCLQEQTFAGFFIFFFFCSVSYIYEKKMIE